MDGSCINFKNRDKTNRRCCYLKSEFFASVMILTLLVLTFSETTADSAHLLDNSEWLSGPTSKADLEGGGDAQFAVWGSDVYLVWDSNGVKFSKSSDNGTTFSEPIALGNRDPDSSVGLHPTIAARGGNVYVVYSSGFDIFLVKSRDGGESFDGPLNISKTKIKSVYGVTEHVISIGDSNHVYISWTVWSGSWSEIFFAQSSDGGKTFGEAKNISDSPDQPSQLPIIATSENEVYVVWYDIDGFYGGYHVSFAGSSDGGATFRRINNLSANSQTEYAFEPSVAIGNDGVYVTWREDTGDGIPRINLAKSSDSGATFQLTKSIAIGGWPALAVEGDNIYIAFGVQDNNGTDNVAFVSSLDGGKTFGDPIMLSNQTWALDYRDERAFPVIAADGSNVYVAWRYTASAQGNHETFLAASFDEGRTFAKQLNLSKNEQVREGNTAYQPSMMASPLDRVFVVWQENTADSGTIMMTQGQIPSTYNEPFRKEISVMTPTVPNNVGQQLVPVVVVGAAIAASLAYLILKRRRSN